MKYTLGFTGTLIALSWLAARGNYQVLMAIIFMGQVVVRMRWRS